MISSKDIIEARKKQEEYFRQCAEKDPEYKKYKEERKKWREEQWAQGKVIDERINRWLQGEISTARTALIVGIILTALIKGQVVIWAIMYIAYRGRVKKAIKDAIEADRKEHERK